MGLSRSDLERLADDTYKGRILQSSVYCERCGYNLRTLPYVYTGPECGNEYNARPLKMKGIFLPHSTRMPVGDVAASGFSLGGALLFGINGIRSADTTRIVIAGMFLLISLPFLWRAYRGLRRLAHTRAVAQQIAMEEGE